MQPVNAAPVETLYGLYPRHVGKIAAFKAISKALKRKPFEELLLAVQAYSRKVARERTDERFIPYPATWFNAGRYDDEELESPEVPLTQYQRDNPNWRNW